jgi:hypothetical protein
MKAKRDDRVARHEELNKAKGMDVLQDALNQATAALPALFLQKLIAKKLQEQGIKRTKSLSERLARHILDGNGEPVKYSRAITLTFTEADGAEIEEAIKRFCDTQLPALVRNGAHRTSKIVLKDLKSRWPDEHAMQIADISEFRERLEDRWGKPLGLLRMLLTMVREWCQGAHQREITRKKAKPQQLTGLLIRLLVRACQVTDEIICLLENGFADGAMARWRTLHEIAVVATVISQYGESIAEQYLAHQSVESKKKMDKYLACYRQLGYKPLSVREQKKIVRNYNKAIAQYGKPFGKDYGWAASHLKNGQPNFVDLEAAAGRADMRAHYQLGNDNVHAGIKSMFVRLGLIEGYTGLLSGRSNAGLTEPGQNAAFTLTQLAALVCMAEPGFDDLVVGEIVVTLKNEIPQAFGRADRQLRKDDKKFRSSGAGTVPHPPSKRRRNHFEI